MSFARPWRTITSAIVDLAEFSRIIFSGVSKRILLGLSALILSAGLTEGLALYLLLPLLQFLDGSAAGSHWRFLTDLLPAMGMQPGLAAILMLFLGVAILRAWLNWKKSIVLHRLYLKLVRTFRISLYRTIANARWQYLRTLRTSNLQASLTSEIDRLSEAVYLALELPSRAVIIIAHIAIAIYIAPAIALLALVVGMVIFALSRRYLEQGLQAGNDLTRAFEELHHQIIEFLSGLKITKIFNAQERHTQAFKLAAENVDHTQFNYAASSASARLLQDILGALAIALFLWISIVWWQLPVHEVLVLALIFYRVLPQLQDMQQVAQQLLHVTPAARSLHTLIEEAEDAREDTVACKPPVLPEPAAIEFHNVSFHYAKDTQPALQTVNLTIPPGGLTVISGPSGAGKSTMLDLLAGLTFPTTGEVRINGELLQERTLPQWRQSVGYVAQEAFLFDDTIRANLLIARPDATEDMLKDALARADAVEFVKALPGNIDFRVGSRGGNLSGGQRQRIAIARSLLRNPALIILDEPANALDAENEKTILETIAHLKGKTTLVLVTHHPDRVSGIDCMISINAAQIVHVKT